MTSRDVVFEEEKGCNWEKPVGDTSDDQLIWEDCESNKELSEGELNHDPSSLQVMAERQPKTSQISPIQ